MVKDVRLKILLFSWFVVLMSIGFKSELENIMLNNVFCIFYIGVF